MISYVIRRILKVVPTVLIVASIIFFVLRLGPGDPAVAILGDGATAEALYKLKSDLGLDKPIFVQYYKYLFQLIRGDLGVSLFTNSPVLNELLRALPNTLELTIWGIMTAVIIGIPAGMVGAIFKNRPADYFTRIFSLIGFSIPEFVLGAILLLVFSVMLGWFPVISAPEGGFFSRPYYVLLPALSVGLTLAGFVARMTRSVLLDVIKEDYIRTARAKGLKESQVIFKHALRNALIPVVTVIGLYVAVLLAGAVVVEVLFNRPGLGRLLVEAARRNDYPLVQGGLVLYATIIILINGLVDIIYSIIDPTIKLK